MYEKVERRLANQHGHIAQNQFEARKKVGGREILECRAGVSAGNDRPVELRTLQLRISSLAMARSFVSVWGARAQAARNRAAAVYLEPGDMVRQGCEHAHIR